MKTYNWTQHRDGGEETFTIEVDDKGFVTKSDHHAAKIGERWRRVANRAGQLNCTFEEATTTSKSDKDEWGEVGELAKFDMDKRLVFGWAYVTHTKDGEVVIDKSGEFIDDPGVLEDAAYDFVIKSRVAGDSHQRDLTADSAVQVGTMVESMVFTPEKVEKMGLPQGVMPTGWWVGFKIDNERVWKDVREGRRPAFSIHGRARKTEVM